MSAGINIANYEVFLLRFIDGDLGAAEVAALQDFLEQHPHIRQELQLLQSTVLTPDPEVVFENKALLYRGTPGIHADNQTGFLLSYIDNELPATEKDAVEKYIAQTPAAQAELALLQQTRLQPDLGQVFLHKASLYRHRSRIRPVYWWSAGAAAVVAGLIVFTAPYGSKDHSGNVPAVVAVNQQQASGTPAPAATENVIALSPSTGEATPSKGDVISLPPSKEDIAAAMPAKAPALSASKGHVRPAPPVTTSVALHTPSASPATAAKQDHESTPAPRGNNNNNVMVASNDIPVTAPANSSTLSHTTTSANNVSTGTAPASTSNAATIAASSQDAAPAKPPVMMAMASPKEESAAPASIHGELIASVVSSGDNKLLDKVTNVARFFAKKKANNK
ncbi:hypothetical protein DCC81_01895 [Chitinophaga parva]|uniref:Uncharacterized protein n=1 Tax=Chitinophaga parva TaxID=2169414 RepID=A0A2T7BKS0_9BACT|nr:hypothetical protein [Chitinophaga parva]PUZ28262.1 hypothetical protein DCC81_01895 [Chitinophaga parva]